MSEKTIWNSLRAQGLTEESTAAVMGNMYCESLLKANNVEDRCPLSDFDYTNNVDKGSYSETTFVHDAYGYGLCQWTYYTRKQALYNYSKTKGASISDEAMQVEFCIKELREGYSSLLNYLCVSTDTYTATSRFCTEFERPAVNNVQDRYKKAVEYYNQYSGSKTEISSTGTEQTLSPSGTGAFWEQSQNQSTDSCEINVRCLRVGDSGDDVFIMQSAVNRKGMVSCGLADGKYGGNTLIAVNALKASLGMQQDTSGTVGQDLLQYLYS